MTSKPNQANINRHLFDCYRQNFKCLLAHVLTATQDAFARSDLFLLYLIWYPLGRFFIEFFRTNSWFFPGTPINVVHLLSAIAIICATTILFIRHRGQSLTKEEDNNSGMDVETTEAPASSQET